QRNKTLCKARIPQIRLAEFGTRPVVSIVSVDQFQLPSRTEWAKVNIDTDCLQAIIHSCAQKVVGNPEAQAGVRLPLHVYIPMGGPWWGSRKARRFVCIPVFQSRFVPAHPPSKRVSGDPRSNREIAP
ncbi:MAG TPA: hypothetical protein VGP63_07250, partial [Planctomycetaceae bacterium]|nr:hypothetical protein [Planctomycetaceae bacterium]